MEVKILSMADIRKCPSIIFLPSHYRADGSCRHDEPNCEVEGCTVLKFEEEIFCERHINEMEGAPCEYENGWCVSHTLQYHDRGEEE